jgi:hypothetical protein
MAIAKNTTVIDAKQYREFEQIAKRTGYSVDHLMWDALHWYLETKGAALSKREGRVGHSLVSIEGHPKRVPFPFGADGRTHATTVVR